MKKLPLLLILAWNVLQAGETPDFKISDILVLQDGFIALKIENAASQDYILSPQARERIFLSLAINGIKRAEYKVKAMDPTIFLKNSFIIFKTNFRNGLPLKMRVEVNGEKVIPESDYNNNILEKDMRPLI
jgi:hypothetical protein